MDDLMPIGEFSDLSGLSPKRLRSYAVAGLLVPAAVDVDSGYRYYAPGQVREAQVIDALRRADVSLADIALLLRDPTAARLDALARRVEVETADRQGALARARGLLELEAGADAARVGAGPDGRKERMLELRTAARTDIGRVRETNQDAVVSDDHLLVVADGLGGAPGGETASGLATAIVGAAYTGRSVDELAAAVRAANTAVFARAAGDEALEGMGTTLCAVGLTDDGQLAVVNVGDSRAYLVREDALERLTTDHTVVAELVRQGELTEVEAREHPHRSVLTRAVGVGPEVEVDAAVQPAVPGDRLLLCSDGLFNEVPEHEVHAHARGAVDLAAAVHAIVDLALANGGRDNVTVVLADVHG